MGPVCDYIINAVTPDMTLNITILSTVSHSIKLKKKCNQHIRTYPWSIFVLSLFLSFGELAFSEKL